MVQDAQLDQERLSSRCLRFSALEFGVGREERQDRCYEEVCDLASTYRHLFDCFTESITVLCLSCDMSSRLSDLVQ